MSYRIIRSKAENNGMGQSNRIEEAMDELAVAVQAAQTDGWEPIGGVMSCSRQYPHATVIWFAQAMRETGDPFPKPQQAELSDIDKPRKRDLPNALVPADLKASLKAQKGQQNVPNATKAH